MACTAALGPFQPMMLSFLSYVPVFGEWRQVDKIWHSQSSKYAVQER
jgi:hypothetical protein